MINIKIPENVKPLYAEEVKVNAGIKMNVSKDADGKDVIRKDGRIEMLFFDNATKTAIARIVIDPITAVQLAQILSSNTKALLKEVDSKEIPSEIRTKIEEAKQGNVTAGSQRYIG